MKVAIDAVGIRGHGGAAVLCELLNWLPIARPQWEWHAFLFNRELREFDDPGVLENVTLEHVPFGNSGRERLQWVNKLLPAQLKRVNADVLFSFANIAPAKAITPQVVFCQQRNAFFADGTPSRMAVRRVRLWFMKRHILRGIRASQAVIVQTNAMRERIEQLEPNIRGRIHTIPSGYRTPSVNPIVRQHVREAMETASHPRLIYVSHPSEHKNHLTLIRALKLIVHQKSAARLMLTLDRVRPGDNRYNGFIDQIRSEAERLGLAKHIVWLGQLTSDEVDFALRSADMMVFPSLSESFGLGLVEAIAAGCPIAASNLPFAHDVARDTAVYFDPNSPESIGQTVIEMLENADCGARLACAMKSLQDRYNYRLITEDISCVINRASNDFECLKKHRRN